MDKLTEILPINKFILCEEHVVEESDLILSNDAQKKAGNKMLKVIAIGDECTKTKLNDLVISFDGKVGKFTYSSKDYLMAHEDGIACVVRDKK